jgi:hypothetical protein
MSIQTTRHWFRGNTPNSLFAIDEYDVLGTDQWTIHNYAGFLFQGMLGTYRTKAEAEAAIGIELIPLPGLEFYPLYIWGEPSTSRIIVGTEPVDGSVCLPARKIPVGIYLNGPAVNFFKLWKGVRDVSELCMREDS